MRVGLYERKREGGMSKGNRRPGRTCHLEDGNGVGAAAEQDEFRGD